MQLVTALVPPRTRLWTRSRLTRCVTLLDLGIPYSRSQASCSARGLCLGRRYSLGWCSRGNKKSSPSQCSWLIVVFDQWLHRSAFSFGGLTYPKDTNMRGPRSSQVMGNLVLGTEETNTKMIRFVTINDSCLVNLTDLVIS